MTTTATALQISDTAALITWTTDAAPAGGWIISRDVDAAGFTQVGAVPLGQLCFTSDFDTPAEGAAVSYRVSDGAAETDDTATLSWLANVGEVNPLETLARYTTTATVKDRLRIPTANTDFDDRILTAILAAEYGIDAELGQSFPNADVPGIPAAITQAATAVATAIYKGGDAPTGMAGGDSMFGELDVAESVRAEIRRNPLLKGFTVAWGIG